MGSALPLDSKYLKTMYGESSCETASPSTASATPGDSYSKCYYTCRGKFHGGRESLHPVEYF